MVYYPEIGITAPSPSPIVGEGQREGSNGDRAWTAKAYVWDSPVGSSTRPTAFDDFGKVRSNRTRSDLSQQLAMLF